MKDDPGLSSFFPWCGLEDGHVPTFWLLLEVPIDHAMGGLCHRCHFAGLLFNRCLLPVGRSSSTAIETRIYEVFFLAAAAFYIHIYIYVYTYIYIYI